MQNVNLYPNASHILPCRVIFKLSCYSPQDLNSYSLKFKCFFIFLLPISVLKKIKFIDKDEYLCRTACMFMKPLDVNQYKKKNIKFMWQARYHSKYTFAVDIICFKSISKFNHISVFLKELSIQLIKKFSLWAFSI